jgi:hypothetical protein
MTPQAKGYAPCEMPQLDQRPIDRKKALARPSFAPLQLMPRTESKAQSQEQHFDELLARARTRFNE